MAITKTDFLEYSRCPRYAALEKVNKDRLEADVSYEEYKNKEYKNKLEELCASMFEVDDQNNILEDKINVENKQLEAMMDYYKQVEIEAGKQVEKMFPGKTIYAEETKSQESFDCSYHGLKFLCYVDIYNESQEEINIIEVKATTSQKYTSLQGGYTKNQKFSIFTKKENIYYLKEYQEDYPLEQEMPLEKYIKLKEKLKDRYQIGAYIYDLAVQRFIIEREYEETKSQEKKKKIHYYLAVLNADYIFDGTYENQKPIYRKDSFGNELITFFALDELTEELQEKVKKDADQIYENLKRSDAAACPLSTSCNYQKQTQCKYFDRVCASHVPKKNSALSYMNSGHGFKDENNQIHKGLQLINEGYIHLLDIPDRWITNPNHRIQRDCTLHHTRYIDKAKIIAGLKEIKYPIYHLDFETFPCPVPRFQGESPFTQSPFEFSLHIEHHPGACDFDRDNIVFLAKTMEDERKQLIETLLANVDVNQGTLFAQNVAFEKGRIKELANCFPEYKEKLMKLYDRGFDLLWIVRNHKEMYEKLGVENAECINFYQEQLSGSYSIKKTLPVFSNLSYENLTVKNGTEAIIEYANYNKMSPEERKIKQEALRIYCKQDTWAMVEILNALRILVK